MTDQNATGHTGEQRIAELEAEFARLRPLAELYPLAWEECQAHRTVNILGVEKHREEAGDSMRAHDKARAERGVE